jgi:hypothetical protein
VFAGIDLVWRREGISCADPWKAAKTNVCLQMPCPSQILSIVQIHRLYACSEMNNTKQALAEDVSLLQEPNLVMTLISYFKIASTANIVFAAA